MGPINKNIIILFGSLLIASFTFITVKSSYIAKTENSDVLYLGTTNDGNSKFIIITKKSNEFEVQFILGPGIENTSRLEGVKARSYLESIGYIPSRK